MSITKGIHRKGGAQLAEPSPGSQSWATGAGGSCADANTMQMREMIEYGTRE